MTNGTRHIRQVRHRKAMERAWALWATQPRRLQRGFRPQRFAPFLVRAWHAVRTEQNIINGKLS